jgi:hypothetical protein
MKANQYTAEQIIKILEQAERSEQTISAVCQNTALRRQPSIAGAKPTPG